MERNYVGQEAKVREDLLIHKPAQGGANFQKPQQKDCTYSQGLPVKHFLSLGITDMWGVIILCYSVVLSIVGGLARGWIPPTSCQ